MALEDKHQLSLEDKHESAQPLKTSTNQHGPQEDKQDPQVQARTSAVLENEHLLCPKDEFLLVLDNKHECRPQGLALTCSQG